MKKRERERTYLDLLGLKGQENKYPSQLSGGQKQRAAIARLLCMDKQILLFDEPTSALDPESVLQFSKMVEVLLGKGITIVISTHDMRFVELCIDKVFLLKDGRIADIFDSRMGKLEKGSLISKYVNGGDKETKL